MKPAEIDREMQIEGDAINCEPDISPAALPVPHTILVRVRPWKGLLPRSLKWRTSPLQSEAPGNRSKVVVRLPVSETETVVQNVEQGLPTQSSSRRVLVIDDDRDVADSLAMLLELLGCDVRTAYSGAAGIHLVTEFRPSVVFLDLGMPDMNGYETARRIRAEPEGQQARLVALTGWGQDADKRRTREAGFDRHLVKPADIDAIEEILSAASDETPQS